MINAETSCFDPEAKFSSQGRKLAGLIGVQLIQRDCFAQLCFAECEICGNTRTHFLQGFQLGFCSFSVKDQKDLSFLYLFTIFYQECLG